MAEREHVRLWLALEEIHKNDLWRLTGAKSFVAYVDERWSIARSTAYRQIAWARAARETAARQLSDPSRARDTPVGGIKSQRQVVKQNAKPRPPRGKAEAVEVGSDDTRAPEAQPGPSNGRGSSPRADGATSPRGALPPTPSPTEQLSLFPVTKLLEEAFNNRKDEVLAIEESKRRQLAKRMRAWADLLDPPTLPEPKNASSFRGIESRQVIPNFKGGKK